MRRFKNRLYTACAGLLSGLGVLMLGACVPVAGQAPAPQTPHQPLTLAAAYTEALNLCYAARPDFSDLESMLRARGFTVGPAPHITTKPMKMTASGKRFGQTWQVGRYIQDAHDTINDLPTFTAGGKVYDQHLVFCVVSFPDIGSGLPTAYAATLAHPNLTNGSSRGLAGIQAQRYISGNVKGLANSHRYDYYSIHALHNALQFMVRRYR